MLQFAKNIQSLYACVIQFQVYNKNDCESVYMCTETINQSTSVLNTGPIFGIVFFFVVVKNANVSPFGWTIPLIVKNCVGQYA